MIIGTGFRDEEISKRIPIQPQEIEVTVKMKLYIEAHETVEDIIDHLNVNLDDVCANDVEIEVNGTPYKGTH